MYSVGLCPAHDNGLFSEGSSVDHESILSDETFLISTSSAVMGVLAVSARVRVLLVRHFGVL